MFISRRKFPIVINCSLPALASLQCPCQDRERMPPLPAATNYQESPYRLFNYINEYQTGPAVSAKAAILVDRTTGTILTPKQSTKGGPASTTKIITAIVALERLSLEQKVEVSARASRVGGSSVYLRPGEVFTVEELLAGALLKSGNDATVALAEAAAGSVEEFAELMNQRAQNLGAQNSLCQSHGLTAPNHYSTALIRPSCQLRPRIPTFRSLSKSEGKWVL